jgi:hypothetical protein
MRIPRATAILVVVAFILSAGPSPAAIINAGFETGDFTGWSTIGLTSVLTKDFPIAPVEGNFQGFLSTGVGAVPAGSLESFLGLAPGSLTSPSAPTLVGGIATEGSAIKQTFSVNPGDRIQFAWNFLTNEATASFGGPSGGPSPFNDTSFATIKGSYKELADTSASFVFAPFPGLPFTGFEQETGWHTFLSDPLPGGSVTLAFGVVDLRDSIVDSALLVDAVPEPSTLLLLGTSLAGIGMSSWRRYRRPRAQHHPLNEHFSGVPRPCSLGGSRVACVTSP